MALDYRSLYDSEYIGHWDLEGRDVVVTIEKVSGGELVGNGGRKSRKPILYFAGKQKGMVCNKTNGRTIASLYGPKVESWAGKRITLFTSTARDPSSGSEVECIRVRPQVPPPPKPAEPKSA